MPVRYLCRHCKVEIGTLPFEAEETIKKIHLFEIGEIDDYLEKNERGETTVHSICEHCEESLRQFPDYYALKKWLQ
ncbi:MULTISPECIES: anti-sigma-F factor Fin [Solibacillus]|uniref:Anti-sigma-F factor Fin family protein n=1 Tax=Solibacillus merdavium TaxID=2762218 RepID=A0ABR8XSD8_9BACL|nr:anti-sigma-F factor Fin [Solibacillus merdavium]MBD8034846.1 anti-sigma-F factor Fin family protein [Solibacillus merdavium]